MRTCSVLLEPELAHERREEGLELTLEGFEDLHISLLGDLPAAPDSSMKIGLMMPLAEIEAHTVHLGECRGRVQATNPLHSPKKHSSPALS